MREWGSQPLVLIGINLLALVAAVPQLHARSQPVSTSGPQSPAISGANATIQYGTTPE